MEQLQFQLETRSQFMHRLIQTVIEESRDDDHVWHAVHEVEEQNGLPEGITGHDCYQLFVSNYTRNGII